MLRGTHRQLCGAHRRTTAEISATARAWQKANPVKVG